MMNQKDVKIVMCAFPNVEQARQIGTVLVETQLAACVNLIPGIRSIYRWEAKVEEQEEVLALFKTTMARYSELQQMVIEMHPYKIPELVVLDLAAGLPAYLQWVFSATQPAEEA
jgi:periplasmic divalent cation tolerance protein